MEEFGIARDNSSYQPTETTSWRDWFYSYLFSKATNSIENGDKAKALNFWTCPGEGRPVTLEEFWKKGGAFLDDSAHELLVWHGVYNTYKTEVIKNFSKKSWRTRVFQSDKSALRLDKMFFAIR